MLGFVVVVVVVVSAAGAGAGAGATNPPLGGSGIFGWNIIGVIGMCVIPPGPTCAATYGCGGGGGVSGGVFPVATCVGEAIGQSNVLPVKR